MKLIRKVHYYMSLIVGLQVAIWLISGFYFNVMDSKLVSGKTYLTTKKAMVLSDSKTLLPLNQVIGLHPNTVAIDLVYILGEPHYLLYSNKALYSHFKQDVQLIDAITAKNLTLSTDLVSKIASQSYSGLGKVKSVSLISGQIELLKQKNPGWRVDFDDEINTSVYINASSGQLLGHSNDHKRLADFFFMLHFMDYAKQGSFNNVLMMFFAFIALWLSFSGFLWVMYLIKNGHYKVAKHKKAT